VNRPAHGVVGVLEEAFGPKLGNRVLVLTVEQRPARVPEVLVTQSKPHKGNQLRALLEPPFFDVKVFVSGVADGYAANTDA
jgi:uroporphyrinogen-III synthase